MARGTAGLHGKVAGLAVLLLLALAPQASATGAITKFSAGLNASSQPDRITVGPDGNLWFTDGSEAIGRATPSGTITEFSTGLNSGSYPLDIVAGPDGNLWFTDPSESTPAIGRITSSGTIAEFTSAVNQDEDPIDLTEPTSIVAGPDGNLWFTDPSESTPAIGRITPSGEITEYELPASSEPGNIVVGPDGNLWFTDPGKGPHLQAIGRITPSGEITEFDTYDGGAEKWPADITVGPDGNLWFTGYSGPSPNEGFIGRITPSGDITTFSAGLPTESATRSIVLGPDGNLWFTGTRGFSIAELSSEGFIGRITPSGTITEFPTTAPDQSQPADLISGPDENLWFTYYEGAPQISRITPSGTITNFSYGLDGSDSVEWLTSGPGGSDLWFTDAPFEGQPAIGRVSSVGPGLTPDPRLTIVTEGNGTVSSSPAGIDCGATCSVKFPSGTPLTITATAAPGFTFKGWNAGSYCANAECDFLELEESECEGTSACALVLGGDTTVAATFGPAEEDEGSGSEGSGPSPGGPIGQSQAAVPSPGSSSHKSTGGIAVAGGVAASKGGSVSLNLSCAGGASCNGVLELVTQAKQGRASKRYGKRRMAKRVKQVVIGKARFAIAAGHSATVTVKLNDKGKALLRQAGKHGLSVQLTGSGIRSRTVQLKTNRKTRRHHRRRQRAERLSTLAKSSSLKQRCGSTKNIVKQPGIINNELNAPGKRGQSIYINLSFGSVDPACDGHFVRKAYVLPQLVRHGRIVNENYWTQFLDVQSKSSNDAATSGELFFTGASKPQTYWRPGDKARFELKLEEISVQAKKIVKQVTTIKSVVIRQN